MSENRPSSTQLLINSIVTAAIEPALAQLPFKMGSGMSKVIMVAYGMQESGLLSRVQLGGGPGRGLWQFEPGHPVKGGGVWGVVNHGASKEHLMKLCREHGLPFDATAIYRQLQHNDILAAGVARLLIWTDRKALPTTQDAAWDMYAYRTWCPGKPRPQDWPANWAAAVSYGLANGWVMVDDKGALRDVQRS
ncbi:MAG: hypothetical protein RSC66_04350 [Comamonas sp.]